MSELVPVNEPEHPWERRPDEPIRVYAQFAHYRNLGPERSLRRAAEDLGKARRTLEEHSSRWDWADRVGAYDDYWEQRRRHERETELLRMEREEAAVGMQMTAIGAARIFGRQAGVTQRGEPVEEIPAVNPADLDALTAAKLVEQGIRIRRLADGQPTDVLKGFGQITPNDLVKVVEGMYEIAIRLLPEESVPRYAGEVQQFIETRRLP